MREILIPKMSMPGQIVLLFLAGWKGMLQDIHWDSCIVEPGQWNHVNGAQNPADCTSQGQFHSELLEHELWWNGPEWVRFSPDSWPKQAPIPPAEISGKLLTHHYC